MGVSAAKVSEEPVARDVDKDVGEVEDGEGDVEFLSKLVV